MDDEISPFHHGASSYRDVGISAQQVAGPDGRDFRCAERPPVRAHVSNDQLRSGF